jgi:hypothetical protein
MHILLILSHSNFTSLLLHLSHSILFLLQLTLSLFIIHSHSHNLLERTIEIIPLLIHYHVQFIHITPLSFYLFSHMFIIAHFFASRPIASKKTTDVEHIFFRPYFAFFHHFNIVIFLYFIDILMIQYFDVLILINR